MDGALTVQPARSPPAGAQRSGVVEHSPPASAEATRVSSLSLARPGASPRSTQSSSCKPDAERGREEPPLGHQAVVVEGAVGVAVASIEWVLPAVT